MTATVSITEAQIYTTLGNFILAQTGVQPIQGYPNRTAMPAGPFVAMSTLRKLRLRTNVDNFATTTDPAPAPGVSTYEQAQQLDVQLDCYGPASSTVADILTTLLRDEVGCLALAPVCQPLYADDPIRAPLTNSEAQYEDKWIVTARLQYNQVVSLTQDYATTLTGTLIEMDQAYPP